MNILEKKYYNNYYCNKGIETFTINIKKAGTIKMEKIIVIEENIAFKILEQVAIQEARKKQAENLEKFPAVSLIAAKKAEKVIDDVMKNKSYILKVDKIEENRDLSIKHGLAWKSWLNALEGLVEKIKLIAIAMDYDNEDDYHEKINILFNHQRIALIAAEEKLADKYVILDWLKI